MNDVHADGFLGRDRDNQHEEERENADEPFLTKKGTYSSEHCTGFSPVSLLIPAGDAASEPITRQRYYFFSSAILFFIIFWTTRLENGILCLFVPSQPLHARTARQQKRLAEASGVAVGSPPHPARLGVFRRRQARAVFRQECRRPQGGACTAGRSAKTCDFGSRCRGRRVRKCN